MKLLLAVTAGPHAGKEFTFDGRDSFLVGRATDAHLRLSQDDPYFSRRHFVVEINPPRCRLLDLRSRNGVCVNGTKVAVCELQDGDQIKAGHTVFRVSVVAPGPDAIGTFQLPAAHSGGTLAPSDVERVDRIAADWLARAERGENPSAEDVCPPDARRLLGPLRERIEGLRQARSPQPAGPSPQASDRVVVPGYDLAGELGRGSMGVVYRAVRRADGTPAAVKVISAAAASEKQIDQFLREARILGAVRHPHVVRFLEAGERDGTLFIAMELVDGPDAGRVLEERGPLEVRKAVRVMAQALAGLAHVHAAGYVHRDVKPANLLIGRAGRRRVVKVADFGLARALETSRVSGLTLNGDKGGTVAYMPPEQITHYRDVTPAADQYSAAASLYHLLTGRLAFDFEGAVCWHLIQIQRDDPVPIRARRPDLPAGLAAVIHKALSRDPAARFPTTAAFRAALVPFG